MTRSSHYLEDVEKYSLEFIRTHYSQTPLYRNFAPHYFVSASKIDQYFPNNEHSMLFSEIPPSKHFNKYLGESSSPAQQWMQLDRFQSISLSTGEMLMFVGGPISAVAWAPIPENTDSQYIAVAYKKDFNDHTLQKQPSPKKTMILIVEQTTTLEDQPHVLYGFKVEQGPVNHLEFMPSGGYSKSMNRLGLLAVSTIETDVHVYSLPISCNIKMEKVEDNFCDTNVDFKFLEIRPSFTLVVDARKNFEISHEKNNMSVLTKWSKGKGHNIIAAGFANGAFAIWNIDEDPDNLSRIYTNSSLKYVPSCYICHMRNQIVGLDFHYDSNGPRWLAVCGITRVINVYDIEDLSIPKIINSDVSFNIMSSMEWPFIWELFCYSNSDWFATYGCCMTFCSPMSLFARHTHKSRTLCGINETAFNPWYNLFLSGTDNGDIVVDFIKELNCPLDSRTFCKDNMLVACTDLARLDSKPIPKKKNNIMNLEEWQWFEDDYKNKYGLLFGSLKPFNYIKHKYLKSMERAPSANLCRYLRINRVKCNTNIYANNIMAVGYNNGFLKIFAAERRNVNAALNE